MSWRSSDAHVAPDWTMDPQVPTCSERCPSFDGKRCEVIGHRPSSLCEPMVKRMGELLDAAEDSGQHQTLKAKDATA